MNDISGDKAALTNPTIIKFSEVVTTQFLLIEMKNDGSLKKPSYIELGGLKGFY